MNDEARIFLERNNLNSDEMVQMAADLLSSVNAAEITRDQAEAFIKTLAPGTKVKIFEVLYDEVIG